MWLLQSRKAQVALGALLTIFLSRLLPKWGFSSEDINVISGSIAAVAGVWIAGISHEDAAAKQAPQNQTNVNSDVRNTPVVPVPQPVTPAPTPDAFTPAQRDAMHREFAAYIAAHTRPKPAPTQPVDVPKGQ